MEEEERAKAPKAASRQPSSGLSAQSPWSLDGCRDGVGGGGGGGKNGQ